VVGWPWLVPGPLAVDDLAGLRGLLRSLSESFGLIALGDVEVAGIAMDPFVVCAGLSDAGVGCGLGVAARVDGRRLPTVLGRELISLDHLTAGSTGLVLLGMGPSLIETERIVASMMGAEQVIGTPSAAMPEPFSFTARPAPLTRGGPAVVAVDTTLLTGRQMGASVAIEQVSAERLMAEQHQSRNASVARLVIADGSLSAS